MAIAANLLDRQFTAEAPNQRWVGDTTEFVIGESGKLYLAAILDLFSRFVVGWAVSAVNDRHLALHALTMALNRRCPDVGLLHHSDRGCTYASEDYQRRLEAHGITCSMSRTGDCYDNAVMEAFFSTVKIELTDRFESGGHAKRELFEYIEVFYNQRRRHSTIHRLRESGRVRAPSAIRLEEAAMRVIFQTARVGATKKPLTSGDQTGPNPTDRAKRGSKRHLICDGRGVPLAVRLTGANRNDSQEALALVDAIPPLCGARGRPRQRPDCVLGDRGYDAAAIRRGLRARHIVPCLAMRRNRHGSGLGRWRWVVERTFAGSISFGVCASGMTSGPTSTRRFSRLGAR